MRPYLYNNLLACIRDAVKRFNSCFCTDFSVEPLPDSYGLCIYFPTKAERWAAKVANQARKAANRGELTIEMHERVTVVFVHEFKSTGIAICSPNDSYNADLGIAIAFTRAMCEVVPDYVL
jgi:hypothetical protein